MKGQKQAGKQSHQGQKRPRVEPVSHDMGDEQLRQALLSDSSSATLADHLVDHPVDHQVVLRPHRLLDGI